MALLVSLTLWASSFPGIKASLDGYSPFALAAVRFLVGSLALAAITPWVRVRWPRKGDLPLIMILASVGVAGYHVALNYGERIAPASTAAFIANLAPLFTTLIASRYLGEAIRRRA